MKRTRRGWQGFACHLFDVSPKEMKTGDIFATRLHEVVMKPSGFKKKSHTFSRLQKSYEEHYNIQGSAWNSNDRTWRFYVNCAISFPDIRLEEPGTGLWKYHAHARLARFVREAPPHFDLSEGDLEETVTTVGLALQKCSDYFLRRHEVLRESYLNRRYSGGFPHDPELQNEG